MYNARDIREWIRGKEDLPRRPWLLLGKGPSFRKVFEFDARSHVKIGLNHVAREQLPFQLDFLHVFDRDVIDSYDKLLLARTRFLVMPDIPNISYKIPFLEGTFFKPDRITTEQSLAGNQLLGEFAKQGRLLVYPRGNTRVSRDDWPVRVGSFSASTTVDLLSKLGVKTLTLAGIDGGTQYAPDFEDLAESTLLNGGQPSFDAQFAEIAETRYRHKMSISYIGQTRPRVFVGAEKEQRLAYEVLKYSINRFSSCDVDVYHLGDEIQRNYPEFSGFTAGLPTGTPFSLQRYAIPHLCDYKGSAIYLDSDMQVFSDVKALWNMPVGPDGFSAAKTRPEWKRPPQLSVMLIDCEKVNWRVDAISERLRNGLSYEEFNRLGPDQREVFRSIPAEWNSLESYEENVTSLLHYTSMPNQPWLSAYNALAPVWCGALLDAIRDGHIDTETIHQNIRAGWVRPSLGWQVEKSEADPLLAPGSVLLADGNFLPPHVAAGSKLIRLSTGAGRQRPSLPQRMARTTIARGRHLMIKSGVQAQAKRFKVIVFKLKRALSGGFRPGWK